MGIITVLKICAYHRGLKKTFTPNGFVAESSLNTYPWPHHLQRGLFLLFFFSAAKGVAPSSPSTFTPELKKNVCYVVAAAIVNEKGEVLMIQEAKR